MKRNRVFFAISIIVIFSMLAGLTASTAQTPPPAAQPTTLNVDKTSAEMDDALPREETLYFNGQQWEPVLCWNPYSTNCNNAMAIAQQDNARTIMFETPYLYDMLDGNVYPLLADGPYTWNVEHTEITFTIKPAAHWSDGTLVTADDVAYTWYANIQYETNAGNNFKDYIDSITAVDAQTVLIVAKLDQYGKAVNPLMVAAYLSSNYVIQKAWTQILEARASYDADAFRNDPAEDVVWSGPYHKFSADDTEVVYIRDDNYWGQDASMWGKLPSPKYLAHVIYADVAAGEAAFEAGEVDVSQLFIPNVEDLWLVDGLPISTYLPDAPYMVGATLPTAFYNLASYGMDQLAVRKAIAIAIDYTAIISDAISNQSATFEQVPRSIMNPTPYEQALYDHDAVADLQWAGNDIAGAYALLDAAEITDTNGDGWREYNGQTLHYVATCPNGWSDWQAAIEIVAAAGRAIGIDVTTNYPEWIDYQVAVTNWPLPDTGYDIFMMWSDSAGPTEPWGRIYHLISTDFYHTQGNWNGNWGGYTNPAADAIIQAIPGETDPAMLKADYTELTRIYLTDIPSFSLMYRPQSFHTVNESVWTGFPHQDDGTNPPVPPLDCVDGWSIACLYNLRLVEPVSVDFSANPTAGPSPLTVAFTNLSTGDFNTCLWDFGDTFTSTLCSPPDHVYQSSDVYTVALTVSGLGGTDIEQKDSYITAYASSQADFTAEPTEGIAPLKVTFTNLSTGDFNTCLWNFGDTITSTLCSPPDHVYQSPGVYTVALTASGLGGTDTEQKDSYITVYASSQADFTAAPTEGIAPLEVVFTNLSSGDFSTSLWDFGDGITSTQGSPAHTYTMAGVYTVSLTESGLGGTDTETKDSYITVYAPVAADFSANPTSGPFPLKVSFTNLSNGDFDTCLWDFGDDITSNLCSPPDHVYLSPGVYTVTLTVSGLGGSDVETKAGYITVENQKFFLPVVTR